MVGELGVKGPGSVEQLAAHNRFTSVVTVGEKERNIVLQERHEPSFARGLWSMDLTLSLLLPSQPFVVGFQRWRIGIE